LVNGKVKTFLVVTQMTVAPQFLSTALSLVLSVLSIAGLVFLTQFAFNSKPCPSSKDTMCVKLSEKSSWAMTASKVAVVLLWIQLLVSLASVFLVGNNALPTRLSLGSYRSNM
jgi:hypothetical protein